MSAPAEAERVRDGPAQELGVADALDAAEEVGHEALDRAGGRRLRASPIFDTRASFDASPIRARSVRRWILSDRRDLDER